MFSEPELADVVLSEIRRLHGEWCSVLGYCIMPDHVHLLALNLDGSLIEFMRLLKGRTASELRGRVGGPLWQRSFHDHLIRRNEDINATLRYLLENPVRAGLVDDWTKYHWSGSLRWPDVGPEFFAVNPSDVMWVELFSDGDSAD
jgi:REP element-mobilizing transposase RayT